MKIDQVDSVSQLQIIGNARKWFGSTEPPTAQTQLGDRWEETVPGSSFPNLHNPRFGGIWEYSTIQNTVNRWLSMPQTHNLRFETNVSGVTDFCMTFGHIYGDPSLYRIQLVGLVGYFRVTSNNDASNYWTLNINYFRSDTVVTNLNNPISTNTQNLTSTFPRIISMQNQSDFVASGLITGNAWLLRFVPTKVGSPAGNLICELEARIRYTRP